MLIDLILDRRDGEEYNAGEFLEYVKTSVFFNIYKDVYVAMSIRNEEETKKALCKYVTSQGYKKSINNYINSVKWL